MAENIANGIAVLALSHIKAIGISVGHREELAILIIKGQAVTALIVSFSATYALAHSFSNKRRYFGYGIFLCDDGGIAVVGICQADFGHARKVIFPAQLDFPAGRIVFAARKGQCQDQNQKQNN